MGGDTQCDPRGCNVGFNDTGSGECLGRGCGAGSTATTYHKPRPPAPPKPAPPHSSGPATSAGPSPARARLIMLRASIIGETDPFLGWSKTVQEQYMAVYGNVGSFAEKKDELERDPQDLFNKDPANYIKHVNEIRNIQARMASRQIFLRRVSQEAADQLQPAVDNAQTFDPIAVRGLPDGWGIAANGSVIREVPDGPVEVEPGLDLPELPLGDV